MSLNLQSQVTHNLWWQEERKHIFVLGTKLGTSWKLSHQNATKLYNMTTPPFYRQGNQGTQFKVNYSNLPGQEKTKLKFELMSKWKKKKSSFFLLFYRASQVVLVIKNLPANAGDIRDVGSVPGLERSSWGGHGNPIQYSCLENPMGRGTWWATVHGVAKSRIQLKRFSNNTLQEEINQWFSLTHLISF